MYLRIQFFWRKMKKILIPLSLSLSLLFVACSKSDGDSSASSSARILPEFNIASLSSGKSLDLKLNAPKTSPYIAQILRQTAGPEAGGFKVDEPKVGDGDCIGTGRGVAMTNDASAKEGSQDLKALVVKSAEPILCAINSLNSYIAAMNLIPASADVTMHKISDPENKTFTIQYRYEPDAFGDKDASYSKLILFDATGNPFTAMMWSKEPKRLAAFAVNPASESNKKDFIYLEAYQKADDFHFKMAGISGKEFFAPSAEGGWMQLSYNAASGAFYGFEGYSLAGKNSTHSTVAAVVKGNVKTLHAGAKFTQKLDSAPASNEFFYYGSFKTDADATYYKDELVNKISDTTADFFGSNKAKIGGETSTEPADKIITLDYIKAVALPDLSAEIFSK